jgi:hypothetical protein
MNQTATTIQGQMLGRNRQLTKQYQQAMFEFRNTSIQSEVLTMVVKTVITTCIPLKMNGYFGGTRSVCCVLHAAFLLGSFLNPVDDVFIRG